jgi:hypothetical protein
MVYAVKMTADGMNILVHAKFCDDQLRNSSNIKSITSTIWESVVLILPTRGIS